MNNVNEKSFVTCYEEDTNGRNRSPILSKGIRMCINIINIVGIVGCFVEALILTVGKIIAITLKSALALAITCTE